MVQKTILLSKSKIQQKMINVLELCAGAGGLALGFAKAGFQHLGLVDHDQNCVQTLKANFADVPIINEDLNLFLQKISTNKDQLIKSVDILVAGLPCQSFSYVGKGQGLQDARGLLFFTFIEIMQVLKPKLFLIENVKGLQSNNHGRTLKLIIQQFHLRGYEVKYQVLNAWDYNVAQKRERLFMVGCIKKHVIKHFQFPQKLSAKPVLKDVLKNVPASLGTTYSASKKAVLKLVPPGGCWRNLPDQIARSYLKNSYFLGGGKTGIARRLSWDEPSLTLTTSPMQKQTERCHPTETRPFTVREYARIQSFPDDWKFYGSVSSQYKQIGNAVPVNLAQCVAESLKKFYLEHFQ